MGVLCVGGGIAGAAGAGAGGSSLLLNCSLPRSSGFLLATPACVHLPSLSLLQPVLLAPGWQACGGVGGCPHVLPGAGQLLRRLLEGHELVGQAPTAFACPRPPTARPPHPPPPGPTFPGRADRKESQSQPPVGGGCRLWERTTRFPPLLSPPPPTSATPTNPYTMHTYRS